MTTNGFHYCISYRRPENLGGVMAVMLGNSPSLERLIRDTIKDFRYYADLGWTTRVNVCAATCSVCHGATQIQIRPKNWRKVAPPPAWMCSFNICTMCDGKGMELLSAEQVITTSIRMGLCVGYDPNTNELEVDGVSIPVAPLVLGGVE